MSNKYKGHTPGPWEVDQTTDTAYIIRPVGPRGANSVAQVLHRSHMRPRSETEANARLLAASPRLLELLRRVVEVVPISYLPDNWLEGASELVDFIDGNRGSS